MSSCERRSHSAVSPSGEPLPAVGPRSAASPSGEPLPAAGPRSAVSSSGEPLSAAPPCEPMLADNPHRFVLFPVQHADLWRMYKQALACFWTAEEVDLAQDARDWPLLEPGERAFVEHVLAFFAGSDGIVMENLAVRFLAEVQWPEARQFYSYQIFNEAVHSETYSLLIDTLVKDPARKTELLTSVQTMPVVRDKAAWALKYLRAETASFAHRLVAFAVVEGVFFSGSFCAIFWLRKRGKMPGLCFSNELISRDEGLHQEFAALLYGKLERRLPTAEVHAIVAEAVEIEARFVARALDVALIGMNAALMTEYVRHVADRLLLTLGHPKLFFAAQPFEWMEMISLQGKASFFERRESSYQRAGIMSRLGAAEADDFTTQADF